MGRPQKKCRRTAPAEHRPTRKLRSQTGGARGNHSPQPPEAKKIVQFQILLLHQIQTLLHKLQGGCGESLGHEPGGSHDILFVQQGFSIAREQLGAVFRVIQAFKDAPAHRQTSEGTAGADDPLDGGQVFAPGHGNTAGRTVEILRHAGMAGDGGLGGRPG